MRDTNLKINVETEGMEEATEQMEMLADAYVYSKRVADELKMIER